jgi:hypothetical protein
VTDETAINAQLAGISSTISGTWQRASPRGCGNRHCQSAALKRADPRFICERLRLSRGPLNEEQINAAAALIDAAATGVEQIT